MNVWQLLAAKAWWERNGSFNEDHLKRVREARSTLYFECKMILRRTAEKLKQHESRQR